MDTDKKIFSTALPTQRGDGSPALSYDGMVYVRTNLGDADLQEGYSLLQARNAIAFDCSNPRCISGTPPLVATASFSIEVQMPFAFAMSGDQQVLLIGATGVAVPIIDSSFSTEQMLCEELSRYRARTGTCMAFHVYEITGTPPELAQVQHKRIALPVPGPNLTAISMLRGKAAGAR
jgi:hypothetical protein